MGTMDDGLLVLTNGSDGVGAACGAVVVSAAALAFQKVCGWDHGWDDDETPEKRRCIKDMNEALEPVFENYRDHIYRKIVDAHDAWLADSRTGLDAHSALDIWALEQEQVEHDAQFIPFVTDVGVARWAHRS